MKDETALRFLFMIVVIASSRKAKRQARLIPFRRFRRATLVDLTIGPDARR